jgi:hypothetical protein
VIRGRETGRTGADDGHPFFSRGLAFYFNLSWIKLIRRQPLQIPDRHCLIHVAPPAGVLTPMGTNPSKYSGQGELFHDNFQGFFIFALFDHLHISLNIKTCRAGKTTGGLISLLNRKSAWYCLGVFLVSSPSLA